MRLILIFLILAIACPIPYAAFSQTGSKLNDTTLLQPVEINAVRAGEQSPFSKTTLSRDDIKKANIGQDLPFLLNQAPSVVVNSDAGNGFGYTGIRIRGADASRINVTLNGIPYNDAESQGTFFVDLPDFSASAGKIQVQRGVGTSSNGAGSFGGSINISTNDVYPEPSLELQSNAGSYSSFRNSLLLHSGLVNKHFSLDARLTDVRSDGYIERASSNLRSFYTSLAYTTNIQSLRLNIFSGKEKTYQAWNGVDEMMLTQNRRFNSAGTEKEGSPYENETDNYTQTHYQLFYNRKLNNSWKGNLGIFLTKGKGYYEQYKASEELSSYGLSPQVQGSDSITNTNLVRRLWLDNDFYGTIFSIQYNKQKTALLIGGSITGYVGRHFGELLSADNIVLPVGYRWYDHPANKTDYSGYVKWTYRFSTHWQSFLDMQVRGVKYAIHGFRDNPSLTVTNNYFFFAPKAGITYSHNDVQAYLSYGRGAKEPNRDDFEAGNTEQPSPEYLDDFEGGIEWKNKRWNIGAGLFYMKYNNQLVLTGKINDVGAYTRTNIKNSYRAGIEITATLKPASWLALSANASISKNKIKNFTEFLDDYDNGGQQTKFYPNTTIAFSPSLIAAANAEIKLPKNFSLDLFSKYVGRQFLDNTANRKRMLKDYYLQDARLSFTANRKPLKTIRIFVQANNIFNKKYEANGYSFSYVYGGALTTENYYFPMAPFNFMTGLNINL